MPLPRAPLRALAVACAAAFAAACADAPLPTGPGDVPGGLEAKGGVPGPPDGKGGGGGGDDGDDGSGFVVDDGFDFFDVSVWTASSHPLGRGTFRPANVRAEGGLLHLVTPAGTVDGGEIQSVDKYRFGLFEASLRASPAPGSLTAFFLYEFGRNNIDEVDIEIVPDYQGEPHVFFVTWLRGDQTNATFMPVADLRALPGLSGYDPVEFHTYGIETSRRSVRFYIDGVLVEEFTDGIPTAAMHVMASTWWPTWLAGDAPASDVGAEIDWIRF